MTDRRAVLRRTGGPDAIEQEEAPAAAPAPGEARVRHEAIGVNFIDTYHRSGLYPLALPSGLGSEAAGVVEAIGAGVTLVAPGDRVAYAGGPLGAYASARTLPADRLVRLPDPIDAETAAAAMLKGMTVDMLVGACGRVQPGMTVLVHAAAGGVGSLAVQWAKALGATVIAHAGTAAKAARARQLGADHDLSCPLDALAAEVRARTDGRGVDLVLDGVGEASWAASLASVARRGLVVSYGNASGPVPPVAPLALTKAGSAFLTRPTLYDYVATRAELEASAGRLFAKMASGALRVEIGARYTLAEAVAAHRALEARATTGSVILLP